MKKLYIYSLCVWIFHKNQRVFIASFLIACALIVVPNKTLSWIGIGFMFTFIALAILGGVDYFIYKKKPLRTAQNFFEYILNNQKAGLFFMALFIVVGLVTAIIDSAQEYRGGALAATGVVLALWLSIFWHQYNKIK